MRWNVQRRLHKLYFTLPVFGSIKQDHKTTKNDPSKKLGMQYCMQYAVCSMQCTTSFIFSISIQTKKEKNRKHNPVLERQDVFTIVDFATQ